MPLRSSLLTTNWLPSGEYTFRPCISLFLSSRISHAPELRARAGETLFLTGRAAASNTGNRAVAARTSIPAASLNGARVDRDRDISRASPRASTAEWQLLQ